MSYREKLVAYYQQRISEEQERMSRAYLEMQRDTSRLRIRLLEELIAET